MKNVMKPLSYRANMETFKARRKFMEKVIADLNNEILNDACTTSERVKLYHALTQAVKVVTENQLAAKDAEIEFRISELEKESKQSGFKSVQ